MAAESEVEMKSVPAQNVNVENYRKLVQTYLNLHVYHAALFWADKIVAFSSGNPVDVYWLAQCMFLLKQYHRAAHLLRSRNLDKTYILCNYLTVKCLLEANELNEALKVLNSMDLDVFLQNANASPDIAIEAGMFDLTPKYQVQSSVLLLKGKVLEAMDNRGLASDCYKQALQCDVYCFEAFDCLIQHHMLTANEECELLNSLPISQQCSTDEAEVLMALYESKLKKYHTPSSITDDNKVNLIMKNCTPSISKHLSPALPKTSQILSPQINITDTSALINTSLLNCISNFNTNENRHTENKKNILENNEHCKKISVENPILIRLQDSLDLVVSQAERLYYNCQYQQCSKLTDYVLKQDPYHSACLPIHISCQVELKQSNKLFTLAHTLVDLYPDQAISWFAVGCYYYIIGKSDSARRFLAKSTSLDRLFGPAWLAYGHSFAVENEHDQAMAAYFKASQLMKGCHLPLLYIGLECGLTNNVRLAEKFFQQAQNIAPQDPFVLHEMGVIAFQNLNYKVAEKHFRDALARVFQISHLVPERWEPLLNNLGHTCRKLKKYKEALSYHQQALVLCPQSASTYSAIAYVYALMRNPEEAVDWFHKALGLRRDDTFSTSMLNHVIEQLSEEQPPYPDAPDYIPDFDIVTKSKQDSMSQTVSGDGGLMTTTNNTPNNLSDMSMSIEVDMPDLQ